MTLPVRVCSQSVKNSPVGCSEPRLPLMRELAAVRLTEGETLAGLIDFSPFVKTSGFATSLIRGRHWVRWVTAALAFFLGMTQGNRRRRLQSRRHRGKV